MRSLHFCLVHFIPLEHATQIHFTAVASTLICLGGGAIACFTFLVRAGNNSSQIPVIIKPLLAGAGQRTISGCITFGKIGCDRLIVRIVFLEDIDQVLLKHTNDRHRLCRLQFAVMSTHHITSHNQAWTTCSLVSSLSSIIALRMNFDLALILNTTWFCTKKAPSSLKLYMLP